MRNNNNGWNIFWICAGAICAYTMYRNLDVLKTAVEAVNDYLKGK